MRWRAALLIFVAAPIAAAALIALLLLLGATPHWVFLPGHAVKAAGRAAGIRVPNGVGVLITELCWWVVVVAIGVVVARRR